MVLKLSRLKNPLHSVDEIGLPFRSQNLSALWPILGRDSGDGLILEKLADLHVRIILMANATDGIVTWRSKQFVARCIYTDCVAAVQLTSRHPISHVMRYRKSPPVAGQIWKPKRIRVQLSFIVQLVDAETAIEFIVEAEVGWRECDTACAGQSATPLSD